MQKIEAVDEKRKRGQEKREGPRARRSGRRIGSVGVGGRGGNWVILSKIPDQALGGAGRAHSNRKLKI